MTRSDNPAARQQVAEQLFSAAISLAQLGDHFDAIRGLQGVEGEALLLVINTARRSDGALMTPGELGRQLRLPSASVTALIDRLEQAGHLHRVRDTVDRRRVLLKPSRRAERTHNDYWHPLNDRVVDSMASLTDDELATIDRFLRQVSAVAREYRDET
ncbi:MarR family protein [Stackebrandtia endophytica]|uniref:MarR family protein n=1 Tax=Stackebrandtia endophytica TaxID=1496996 RepID=A0A543B134_9ACTN|nr:MarR family transcriptional regulator [Stackebrandtia endophytica]TQL78542.1 MarR family protein [Stackebrandtia endophytica]